MEIFIKVNINNESNVKDSIYVTNLKEVFSIVKEVQEFMGSCKEYSENGFGNNDFSILKSVYT